MLEVFFDLLERERARQAGRHRHPSEEVTAWVVFVDSHVSFSDLHFEIDSSIGGEGGSGNKHQLPGPT